MFCGGHQGVLGKPQMEPLTESLGCFTEHACRLLPEAAPGWSPGTGTVTWAGTRGLLDLDRTANSKSIGQVAAPEASRWESQEEPPSRLPCCLVPAASHRP